METMTATCGYCAKQYEPKKVTSKFCSDACRVKSHKKEKKATAASTPVSEVSAIEQAWRPTKRESVLNKLLADSDFNIFRMQCLAEKMESSPLVEEILAVAKQATHVTFHNEVRQEVDGYDMIERMHDWNSFEARTGLEVPYKKKPL